MKLSVVPALPPASRGCPQGRYRDPQGIDTKLPVFVNIFNIFIPKKTTRKRISQIRRVFNIFRIRDVLDLDSDKNKIYSVYLVTYVGYLLTPRASFSVILK